MRVEHGAHGPAAEGRDQFGDQAVQERFGRRFTSRSVDDAAAGVDADEIVGGEY